MTSREKILEVIESGGVVRIGTENEQHLRAVADELGVKIRKKGCQSCINEAFLTIRAILLGSYSKKINTTMSIENYELIRKKPFERRVGKLYINNPLAGKEGHGKTFDFTASDAVLFDIWQYNPTGYREFFEFVPKASSAAEAELTKEAAELVEAHNEFVVLLDGVEQPAEEPKKTRKRKK